MMHYVIEVLFYVLCRSGVFRCCFSFLWTLYFMLLCIFSYFLMFCTMAIDNIALTAVVPVLLHFDQRHCYCCSCLNSFWSATLYILHFSISMYAPLCATTMCTPCFLFACMVYLSLVFSGSSTLFVHRGANLFSFILLACAYFFSNLSYAVRERDGMCWEVGCAFEGLPPYEKQVFLAVPLLHSEC
ncbi:hypothetical protein BRADI_1g03956v3 [Brachypodium distachyon]|uniref:Uncharacterized protein n=2 Tax=Brachypodium distachyon TaxID=15368 RepID=A0A0Q3JJU3_BRADI|nr:hypothetical protein BRADI_1g03956v3 [Brachypodium distachyon]PNT73904.1 hypothetical protein BRADI_1g03956v3 [Brachypodium distachyon]